MYARELDMKRTWGWPVVTNGYEADAYLLLGLRRVERQILTITDASTIRRFDTPLTLSLGSTTPVLSLDLLILQEEVGCHSVPLQAKRKS